MRSFYFKKNEKLFDAIWGTEHISFEADYYTLSYSAHSVLPDIIKALENVNIQELEEKFNPKILKKEKIYPGFWESYEKDEWFGVLIAYYDDLLNFYRKAKDKNANVLILIDWTGEYDVEEEENKEKDDDDD
jgi:hypothetical protein